MRAAHASVRFLAWMHLQGAGSVWMAGTVRTALLCVIQESTAAGAACVARLTVFVCAAAGTLVMVAMSVQMRVCRSRPTAAHAIRDGTRLLTARTALELATLM